MLCFYERVKHWSDVHQSLYLLSSKCQTLLPCWRMPSSCPTIDKHPKFVNHKFKECLKPAYKLYNQRLKAIYILSVTTVDLLDILINGDWSYDLFAFHFTSDHVSYCSFFLLDESINKAVTLLHYRARQINNDHRWNILHWQTDLLLLL